MNSIFMTGSRIGVTVLVSAMWACIACVHAADPPSLPPAGGERSGVPSAELLEFLGGVDIIPSPAGEKVDPPPVSAPPPSAPEPKQ